MRDAPWGLVTDRGGTGEERHPDDATGAIVLHSVGTSGVSPSRACAAPRTAPAGAVSAAEQLSVGCVNAGEAAAIAADGLRRERAAESGRRDVNKTVASANSSLQLAGSAA